MLNGPASAHGFKKILGVLYTNAAAAKTPEEQLQVLQKNLEGWFHEYSERMPGWYKRDNRKYLFLAGLADVDTVRQARFLSDSGNAKTCLALVATGVGAVPKLAPAGLVFNPADSAGAGLRPQVQYRWGSLAAAAGRDFRGALATVPAVGLPLGVYLFFLLQST